MYLIVYVGTRPFCGHRESMDIGEEALANAQKPCYRSIIHQSQAH